MEILDIAAKWLKAETAKCLEHTLCVWYWLSSNLIVCRALRNHAPYSINFFIMQFIPPFNFFNYYLFASNRRHRRHQITQ